MYAMLAPMGKSARDDASLLWLLDFAFTMSIQPDSTRTSIHPSPSMSQSTPSLIFPIPALPASSPSRSASASVASAEVAAEATSADSGD